MVKAGAAAIYTRVSTVFHVLATFHTFLNQIHYPPPPISRIAGRDFTFPQGGRGGGGLEILNWLEGGRGINSYECRLDEREASKANQRSGKVAGDHNRLQLNVKNTASLIVFINL